MIIEIKIPEIDKEAEGYTVVHWFKENGSFIKKNEELVEIESDIDTYLIPADEDGILEIVAEEGSFVKPNDVLYNIKTENK
jgi:2-oxoglutarate dehydrogenase E2 component (dihydrolipoamide succinyltransferase)